MQNAKHDVHRHLLLNLLYIFDFGAFYVRQFHFHLFKKLGLELNMLSQLGTERVPHGGKHFWKVYGGF